jgi:hypothetical protein
MKDEWVKDYQSGLSTHAVAAKHGVSQRYVWDYLVARGVTRPRGQIMARLRANADSIVRVYRKGETLKGLAYRYGCSVGAIRKILVENDAAGRPSVTFRHRLRTEDVKIGTLSPSLQQMPDEDLTALFGEARARGKTIAQVLVEDWAPE